MTTRQYTPIWVLYQQASEEMSVSKRLRHIASYNSMTLKDLSAKTGIKYRTIQNYLGSERAIGGELLTALSQKMGISASWLLTGEGPMLLSEMPANQRIQPAETSENTTVESNGDFVPVQRLLGGTSDGSHTVKEVGTDICAFNSTWLARRGLKADLLGLIAVKGDSMEPDLYEGDLALINHADTTPKDSYIYAVRYSGELFIKRIQTLPNNRIELRSTNPLYGAVRVALSNTDAALGSEVSCVGRVVASLHEW